MAKKSEAQRLLDEMTDQDKKKQKPFKFSWKKISIALSAILIISIAMNILGAGSITGFASSGDSVAEDVKEFIETSYNLDVEIESVTEESGLYAIKMIVSDATGTQPYTSYATKDGKLLFPTAIPLSEVETPQQTAEAPVEYSAEDIAKIETFVTCLAEKNVKIYGANWCGWTKKLVVDTFGGFDVAEPIYVECTENEELCAQKIDTGYPTIRIDDEVYSGLRTFEAIAQAAGCEAPAVGEIQASSDTGSC